MSNFDYYIAVDTDGKTIAEGESLGAVEAQANDYCDKTGKKIIINGHYSQPNRYEEGGRMLVSEDVLDEGEEVLTVTPNN
jgi:hypothetical protein